VEGVELRIIYYSFISVFYFATINDALAEWLRRVPAKYMGFPRESSNLSGVVRFFPSINLSEKTSTLCRPEPFLNSTSTIHRSWTERT
jgi:hypothetical protein